MTSIGNLLYFGGCIMQDELKSGDFKRPIFESCTDNSFMKRFRDNLRVYDYVNSDLGLSTKLLSLTSLFEIIRSGIIYKPNE